MESLLPGTEVAVRGLRWEVVFSQGAGDQQLYRLRCLEGSLRGEELDVLSPFERIEPITTEMQPEKAAHLPDWRVYHQAFLLEQALGPSALLAAQPGRIQIQPYQLVPVMRALRMSRVRLLLADGVGLGKTVEAGLVLAELIARRRAHRILIVSPAGPLLEQWRQEMSERFGLRFRVLDRDSLQEIRYASEVGSNPFDHEALGLISIDFAKQESVLQDLERTQFDVVVVDEAHHCVKLGEAGDREDSQRRLLAEVLARQTDNLLLLTATPHDGYDPHFASIIELLDPSLVDGRGALRGEAYRGSVVRRLKRHIKDPATGLPLFRERHVHPTPVAFSAKGEPAFAQMQQELLELVAPQLRRAIRQRRYSDVLAFISLLKRSVSTARACRETLTAIGNRLETLATRGSEEQEARKERLRTLRVYNRRLDRFGVLSFEEEQDRAGLEAEDMAAELAEYGVDDLAGLTSEAAREVRREGDRLARLTEVRSGLGRLVSLAARAEVQDPKLAALLSELKAIRQAEPHANVLVYTEYTDSQQAAAQHLNAAVKKGELAGEVLVISGADSDGTRMAVTNRFREQTGLVLISTDATAEGLNLHTRCHQLIHLELPYNPNRLEQRNGRIDRFGQTEDPQVRYLFLTGTFEERLLLRLIAKYERQRARLTFVPNTLGVLASGPGATTMRLLEGLVDEGPLLFKSAGKLDLASGEDEDTANPAYRELLAEVDRAFSGFEKAAKAHAWLGEVGIAADEKSLNDAARARGEGSSLAVTDLLDFVLNAVRLESADPGAVRRTPEEVWELKLGSQWTHGLTDLPGYDSERRLLRLTTDVNLMHDAEKRPVAYLGRAHPIVRRGLDRVRNLQFGMGSSYVDRRVSVALTDEAQPAILFTFLGRVQSAAGREFERVIAVFTPREGDPRVFTEPGEWLPLTAPERAVPTGGQWKRHFEAWGLSRGSEAQVAAQAAFSVVATTFLAQHRSDLGEERRSLLQWLGTRTTEICGPLVPRSGDLFEQGPKTMPRWMSVSSDAERLAAFATDPATPRRSNNEANGVLELFRRRSELLERHETAETVKVTPLGMLLLVPREPGTKVPHAS